MPDLRVTTEQAARLWGIDRTRAQQALGRMVDAGFLVRAGNVYRRTS
jgi:DNA-binding GntR family transcriptional regulator